MVNAVTSFSNDYICHSFNDPVRQCAFYEQNFVHSSTEINICVCMFVIRGIWALVIKFTASGTHLDMNKCGHYRRQIVSIRVKTVSLKCGDCEP